MPLELRHPTAPHEKLKLPEWYISNLMMDRALDAICQRVKKSIATMIFLILRATVSTESMTVTMNLVTPPRSHYSCSAFITRVP
jgi:hypothetical protein